MKRYFSNVPKSSVGSHSIEQPVQTPNENTLSENVELTSNLDEIELIKMTLLVIRDYVSRLKVLM